MEELSDFSVSAVTLVRRKRYPSGHSLMVEGRAHNGLTLVLSGKLELTFPSTDVVSASSGDIILQRRGDYYRLEAVGDTDVDYIVVSYLTADEKALGDFLPVERVYTPVHKRRIKELFEKIPNSDNSFGIYTGVMQRACVQEILCYIATEVHPDQSVPEVSVCERAKQYIEENFDSQITAEDIERASACSVSHLIMLFKKSFEISPMRYLCHVRVEKAKEMLESGLFCLEEVATSCGFQNVYYFSKVFKDHVGIPPGKFAR